MKPPTYLYAPPRNDAIGAEIPAGTEYGAAIARLLYVALGDADYRIDFPPTGHVTAKPIYLGEHSDFYAEAVNLAKSIGLSVARSLRAGVVVYELVPYDPNFDDERLLAMDLAFATGHLHVDDVFKEITASEWSEWSSYLRKRRGGSDCE
jgi:hypothetical protein